MASTRMSRGLSPAGRRRTWVILACIGAALALGLLVDGRLPPRSAAGVPACDVPPAREFTPVLQGHAQPSAAPGLDSEPVATVEPTQEPENRHGLSVQIGGLRRGEIVSINHVEEATCFVLRNPENYAVGDKPWTAELLRPFVPTSVLIVSTEHRAFANVPLTRATPDRIQVQLESGRLISGRVRTSNGDTPSGLRVSVTVYGSGFRNFVVANDQGEFEVVAPWRPVNLVALATPQLGLGQLLVGEDFVAHAEVAWASHVELQLDDPAYLVVQADSTGVGELDRFRMVASCDGVALPPTPGSGRWSSIYAAWPGTWTVRGHGATVNGEAVRGEQTVRVDGPSPDRVHLRLVKAD